MESSNGYVSRQIAGNVEQRSRDYKLEQSSFGGLTVDVDPAKALFFFLNRLWADLKEHHLHAGFDIRTYLSASLGTYFDGSAVPHP